MSIAGLQDKLATYMFANAINLKVLLLFLPLLPQLLVSSQGGIAFQRRVLDMVLPSQMALLFTILAWFEGAIGGPAEVHSDSQHLAQSRCWRCVRDPWRADARCAHIAYAAQARRLMNPTASPLGKHKVPAVSAPRIRMSPAMLDLLTRL